MTYERIAHILNEFKDEVQVIRNGRIIQVEENLEELSLIHI